MTDAADRLKTALADRYTIERGLGAGGMATVYLAHDLKHDRQVALKLLRPELGAVLGIERFLSEIRVTAQLQHPHILPLFDSGQAEGLVFYVMPFVTGETLRDRLDREKQLGVLAWVPADGSGPAESLYAAPDEQWAGVVTPDGQTLVFRSGGGGTAKRAIWLLPFQSAQSPQVLLTNQQFENHSPSLSPDGRWIAYVSDEAGQNELYVRPFPGPGGRWQVSLDGSVEPRWSPTGWEIFYRNGNKMMTAAVETRPTFATGERRQLFAAGYNLITFRNNYDVTPDGREFLTVRPVTKATGFVVVLNAFQRLRRGGRNGR